MSCATADDIVLNYYENDTMPFLRLTYKDSDGNAIDISGFAFECKIGYEAGTRVVVGTIIDATGGIFEFQWSSGDLDTVGIVPVQITITNLASKRLTFDNIKFNIEPEL
jgi:hypothetical protein